MNPNTGREVAAIMEIVPSHRNFSRSAGFETVVEFAITVR
jgi:hypothetical protein